MARKDVIFAIGAAATAPFLAAASMGCSSGETNTQEPPTPTVIVSTDGQVLGDQVKPATESPEPQTAAPQAPENATPDNNGYITLSDGSKLWGNYMELEGILDSSKNGLLQLLKDYNVPEDVVGNFRSKIQDAYDKEQEGAPEAEIVDNIIGAVEVLIPFCSNPVVPNVIRTVAVVPYYKYHNSWTPENATRILDHCSLN